MRWFIESGLISLRMGGVVSENFDYFDDGETIETCGIFSPGCIVLRDTNHVTSQGTFCQLRSKLLCLEAVYRIDRLENNST